jgi:hypothetical protein
MRHGKGTQKYANGNHYTGDWDENLRTGYGVLTWQSGDRYEMKYS